MDRKINKKYQDLKENLKYLKLNTIKNIYEEAAKKAEEEPLSYTQYLENLITEEVQDKLDRAIKKRIREARFPVIKTIDRYDFNYPKKINKQQILGLFDLNFVKPKENVILLGNTGVGKSHIGLSLGYAACQENISTRYTTAIDIVNDLYASLSDKTFEAKLKQYLKPAILIIDEFGYLPIDKKGADSIFQVISKRYEQSSIILTSNLAFKQWGKIFADNTTAAAIVDRLVHHAEIIKIEGDSYRLKDKDKKSLVDE